MRMPEYAFGFEVIGDANDSTQGSFAALAPYQGEVAAYEIVKIGETQGLKLTAASDLLLPTLDLVDETL